MHTAGYPELTLGRFTATGQSEPVKVFDRHATLNDTQIINYKTSSDEKWMVLIGIKSEVSLPDQPLRRAVAPLVSARACARAQAVAVSLTAEPPPRLAAWHEPHHRRDAALLEGEEREPADRGPRCVVCRPHCRGRHDALHAVHLRCQDGDWRQGAWLHIPASPDPPASCTTRAAHRCLLPRAELRRCTRRAVPPSRAHRRTCARRRST